MRRKDREVKDFSEIIDILSRSKVLHLALISDGKPYSVPVNFGYTVTENNGAKKLSVFFHGAGEGKKLDAIKENPAVSFCAEACADVSGGANACDWTCYYESVIGFGTATILDDKQACANGLDAIMLHNGYKIPAGVKVIAYNAMYLAKTAVVKIDVSELTGKRHVKKQEENNMNAKKTADGFTIKYNELSANEFMFLWESVWGDPPSLEQTELAMKNTLFRVSIFDGQKIVAMARAVGDKGLCYYIKDVVVHPDYQGRGLGRTLICEILEYINNNGTEGTEIAVELCAMPDKIPFYEKFGFAANEAQRLRIMQKVAK